MSGTIQVLVADDHALIRAGIHAIVAETPDIEIVAETDNADTLPALCQHYCPGVLVLDIYMPGPPLAATLSLLHRHCPEVAVVILSAHADALLLRTAYTAGIAGYVVKDDAPENLPLAIRAAACGTTWYSQAIIAQLLEAATDPLAHLGLTVREIEILLRLAQGLSNRDISQQLHLTRPVVRKYASEMYKKLGVRSRIEAVLWAHAHGLGRTNNPPV